jgi:hypothetical protein
MNIEVAAIYFHRNGICGTPFYAVDFYFIDEEDTKHFLTATLFEGKGNCAVLTRGDSSYCWRGDNFEDALREAVKQFPIVF